MKIKIPKALKLILKLVITVAALYFVFRKIDLHLVLDTFINSRFWLILIALLFFILSKVVSSFRLNKYFDSIDIHLSEFFNMKLYLLGMYYNLFLPGGIGGDGYKVYFLNKRYDVRTSRIFWAVLLDRVIGVLALFCIAFLFAYFIAIPPVWKYFLLSLIPLFILAAWLIYRQFFPYFSGIFFRTNIQSLLVQILQIISALLILFSFSVSRNIPAYLFVFLVSSIVAVLPLTIGGVGSREFTFLLGAQWLGLDINLSIALSFMFYLITAFTSFWGIIYSLHPGFLRAREVKPHDS